MKKDDLKIYSSADEMFDSIKKEQENESIFEKIFDFFRYTIWHRLIKDSYYALRHRLFYKHFLVKTTLKRYQWYDTDTRLLYANMVLLDEFLKYEKPFEVCDWTSDIGHLEAAAAIHKINAWWKNYDNRCKEIDNMLTTWYNASQSKDKKAEEYFKILHEMEDKLKNEENEMLKKLIDVRGYLWT